MKPAFRFRNFSGRNFAYWLEDSLHNLAAFSICLIVFAGVYMTGHYNGERAGAAMTTAAFEKCGKPYCLSDFFLQREPAP